MQNLSKARTHKYFKTHKVAKCSVHLDSLAQSDTPVGNISSLYDSLDRDITKGLLHAKLHSSRAPYGSPWSPTLMQKGQKLIFWKHHCSDFRQYNDTLASIPDINTLSSRSDFHLMCKNRYTLHYSLNCLHAARFSLDECHQHASHLRHKHLMEQARLAAETSNVPAEAALNNILKAEAISATFRKLKIYAKGEHCTTLQRVEIPILDNNSQPTGASKTITNPSELFSVITNQNILHFS